MDKQRRVIASELVYAAAILVLSFAVSMMTSADLGISVLAAPAYILSEWSELLSFGQAEYILQGVVFILFCCLMRQVRLVFFCSFVTSFLYGVTLDGWRALVPWFNPDITPPGSQPFPVRVLFFFGGMVLVAAAVALFYRTYLYPSAYDFFVKGISHHYQIDRTKCRIAFDVSCFVISCVMTLLFFRRFVGIGAGTLIMTCCNGILIGKIGNWLDRHFCSEPKLSGLAGKFEL